MDRRIPLRVVPHEIARPPAEEVARQIMQLAINSAVAMEREDVLQRMLAQGVMSINEARIALSLNRPQDLTVITGI